MGDQAALAERIRSAEIRLRNYLTLDSRVRRRYTGNSASWSIVVAALDALGDSELALTAYLTGREPANDGEGYLRMYGVLQALILEQDAIKHLLDELAEPGTKEHLLDRSQLHAARRIRIRVAGHPVRTRPNTKTSEPAASHQIARYAVRSGGIVLSTASETGTDTTEQVSVPSLILEQRQAVADAIEGLVGQFTREIAAHREHHRSEQLRPLLEPTTAELEADPPDIRRRLQSFRAALARRGTPLDSHYDIVRLTVQEVEEALDAGSARDDVRRLLRKMVEMAGSIDAIYNSPPS